MSQTYWATFNKALTTITVVGVGYALYKFSKTGGAVFENVDKSVDFFVDPIADSYYQWKYGVGEDSITPSFDVKRLNKDYFYSDWSLKPEAREVLFHVYEDDMNHAIGADGKLKMEYRDLVTIGSFAPPTPVR